MSKHISGRWNTPNNNPNSLNNKEILIPILRCCNSTTNYRILFNQTLPYSEARSMVIRSWNAFIIKQIPYCKTITDYIKLFRGTLSNSKAEKIILKLKDKFILNHIIKPSKQKEVKCLVRI